MPLLIKTTRYLYPLLLAVTAQASGFFVIGSHPGSWPEILGSVGFTSAAASQATIYVARPGTPVSANWSPKLEAGAVLILEGESPLAAAFGFRVTPQNVQLSCMLDVHAPELPLVLEKPVEIHRSEIASGARVFAKDRWSGAPTLAGFRKGKGAVLWLALNPGEHGFERYPYIPHALRDLGVSLPFRGQRLWAFFDYSYRTRVDLDYFAAKWRAAGISALHVAAWHFYDADPARDRYLAQLVEACHREGILVYAWLELPHVSEKFWDQHPEWREKTAVLQDAALDWRKLMNLSNPACASAVRKGIEDLISRFNWDGANLAELYFESLEGAGNPARFTPMNDDVRAGFRASGGFDPLELWSTRKDAASLQSFLEYRAGLARNLQQEWLTAIEGSRRVRPDLDIVLTHVDDRMDRGMRDAIGAESARVLPLLESHDFTFMIEDPATVWNLGPGRYPEIAKRYPAHAKLAIDINVVERYQDVYPTKQQTGTELFQLVHLASQSFPRVALYFENSLGGADMPFLPAASAVVTRYQEVAGHITVESPYGVGLPWAGPAMVDGSLWPGQSDQVLWLPAGTHLVGPAAAEPSMRILDFNGSLTAAQAKAGRVEFAYQSSSRALAKFEHLPTALEVDGRKEVIHHAGNVVLLPRGQHLVVAHQ